ncbi:hypothetical protein AruPA_16555 [Acidiphilium sp. PA]|uniref:hypothetical protein n=1 Tax=Acidiphilium sp. PA TaxID=2871705 RepID=UPI002242EE47|nr:hypothetical protein [Acidiphilium sp. PA]MCW8308648.1 hypothetical protein [Acidiphilium sp. PA]
MSRSILYYVHHHGQGHLDRAKAIALQAPERFVLLGTRIAGRTGAVCSMDLDDDRPNEDGGTRCAVTPALHYAPQDHPGIRNRVATIAETIARRAPALFVVDVSVEVGWLAVLASVPMVYVRLSGDRSDVAHEMVFRAAHRLIAPFHQDLDDPATPAWVVDKTIYLPGLTAAAPVARANGPRVLVVAGAGGTGYDGERIAAACRATPGFQWRCIGPVSQPAVCPDNLVIVGWSPTPEREIAAASVVVGAAGDGLVSAVLAVNRPFICLPEVRPYQEQLRKAEALTRMKAAVVEAQWPEPAAWPALLERALCLDPRATAHLHDGAGVAHAAEQLIAMAQMV